MCGEFNDRVIMTIHTIFGYNICKTSDDLTFPDLWKWHTEWASNQMSKPFYHGHQSFSCRPWAIISTPDASNGWYLWNDMKERWGCWGTVMSTVLFIEWNRIIQYFEQQYKIKMACKIKILQYGNLNSCDNVLFVR